MKAADQERGRAIVTYARSWQALSAIRSLGRRGVEVVAADEYAITPGSMSRYTIDRFDYPSPEHDEAAFVDVLAERVAALRPPAGVPYVLMPIFRETYVIAKHRQRFEGLIEVPLAAADKFELLKHKGRLVELAQRHGVHAPPTWQPASLAELKRGLENVKLPAFVKLPTGAAGIGVLKVDTPVQLVQAWETLVQARHLEGDALPLVQGYAPGDDYCVTTLFDRGRRLVSMTYKNVIAFPRDGGPGAVRETVRGEVLEKRAEALLSSVGWHGMAQVDFRWTGQADDEPAIIEVNPRFFGGLHQAIESGVDYPYLLFRMAAGLPVPLPKSVELGMRTETPLVGLLATLSEIVEQESKMEELELGWQIAKDELERGDAWSALRTVVEALGESVDVEGRVDHVRRVLEQNADNVSMLFEADDPLPVLGLVYPLAVFLRHGTLSGEALTGTGPAPRR